MDEFVAEFHFHSFKLLPVKLVVFLLEGVSFLHDVYLQEHVEEHIKCILVLNIISYVAAKTCFYALMC